MTQGKEIKHERKVYEFMICVIIGNHIVQISPKCLLYHEVGGLHFLGDGYDDEKLKIVLPLTSELTLMTHKFPVPSKFRSFYIAVQKHHHSLLFDKKQTHKFTRFDTILQ